jgi:hypothetical protein
VAYTNHAMGSASSTANTGLAQADNKAWRQRMLKSF